MPSDLIIRLLTACIFSLIFWGVLLFLPPLYFSLLLAVVLIIMLLEWRNFPTWSWLLAPVYAVLPMLMLIYLNQSIVYRSLLYYLFATVFVHDAGAYVLGSTMGRHTIFPSISPKKSWQGLLGGFIAAILTLLVLSLILKGHTLSLSIAIPLAYCICVIGTAGDFFESWLKRKASLKNSGSLLPGHGGLLDRFDSVLSTTLFFFLLRERLVVLLF